MFAAPLAITALPIELLPANSGIFSGAPCCETHCRGLSWALVAWIGPPSRREMI